MRGFIWILLIGWLAAGMASAQSAAPGRARPPLAPGRPADLVLMRDPWVETRSRLDAAAVRATWIGGELVFDAEAS